MRPEHTDRDNTDHLANETQVAAKPTQYFLPWLNAQRVPTACPVAPGQRRIALFGRGSS
jgi:hypothetical protein